MSLNQEIAAYIRSFAEQTGYLDYLMIILAEYGAYVIPPTLVVMFLLKGKNRSDSLFIFFLTVLSIEISYIVSSQVYFPRPFELYETLLSRVPQNTFPSQHAATLFAFTSGFIYKKRKKLALIFFTITLLNTFARIFVGFHFPLDILAGIATSFIALGVMILLENSVNKMSEWTEEKQKQIEKVFQNRFSHINPKQV